MAEDKVLTKIAALLRHAEGTDNPEESASYTEAAQRLATGASIDLAVARARARADAPARKLEQRTIRIGEAGKRGLRTYVELFVAIAQANEVRCDIASNATFVLAYGYPEDIDTCAALYASLLVQMVRESDAYLRGGEYRVDGTAPVTARINFQAGFAARIHARLAKARAEALAERAALEAAQKRNGDNSNNGKRGGEGDRSGASSSSMAVALRNKDLEVTSFYKQQSSARGRFRTSAESGQVSGRARRAGDRAGRRARLHLRAELGE